MTQRFVISGAAAALAWGSAAWAQPPVIEDKVATLAVTVENDGYFGSDDNYTSGVRAAYLSGNRELDALARFFARRVFRIDAPEEKLRVRRGISVAQEIYTPREEEPTEPQPDEHPYAGYLYAKYTGLIEQPGRVDQFSLQIGVVGPASLAELTQNAIHDLYGREKFQGWDNQIGNTPAVNVAFDRQWRFKNGNLAGPLGWDMINSAGMSFGSVEASLRAGTTLRFGENLQADYGPPRVRPSLAGSGFFTPSERRSWYLFVGTQVEAVGYNIFLDGAFYRDDDPSVEKKALVADLQSGAALQLGRNQIAFTYVLRTEEFSTQEEMQQFGALSLSRRF